MIVTADYGHASQIVETGVSTPGLTTTLLTADDAPMTISYGTAPAGESQEHTGTPGPDRRQRPARRERGRADRPDRSRLHDRGRPAAPLTRPVLRLAGWAPW